jgi:hypothetical protein
MNDERDRATEDEAGVETGQWQDDHDRLPQVDPPDEPKEPGIVEAFRELVRAVKPVFAR